MCSLNGTVLSSDLRLFHATASLILAVVGTFGNALSIALIYRGRLCHAFPTMMMLVNLCIADLISTAVILPIIAGHSIGGQWTNNDVFCRAFGYILYVGLTTECIILGDISIVQYLVIVRRLSNYAILHSNRGLNVFMLMGGPWVIVSIIFLIPLTEVWDKFGYDPRRGYCTILNQQDSIGFHGAMAIFLLATMTITIFYCYPAIFYTHFKSKQKTTTSVLEAAARFRGRTRNTQLVKLIVVIIANYVFTYLPYMIISVADPCVESTPLAVYTTVIYLSWSHTATNPIIYALTNTKINVLWRSLISCKPKKIATHAVCIDQLKARYDTINGSACDTSHKR